jgi:transcriptional antiterminator NusG
MNFFVLRVASNKEDRVREALDRKVKIEGSRTTSAASSSDRARPLDQDGKRRDSDRKLYPGYVFIELELDKNGMIPEKVWFTIKETEGVGDFIGSNGKPTPMSVKDQAKMVEEAEKPATRSRRRSSSARATR